MQIAKGGGRKSLASPESVNHVDFLEASDDSPSNMVENVLTRVAEYVEPAASKTTEIIDALNRAVVGDENTDQKPKRKSFMEALNQANSVKNDETLSVTDLDEVIPPKPTRRFEFSAKDISNMLEKSLHKSLEKPARDEENLNPLPTTSQYVEPTYSEILSSVFSLIDEMERSIHRFELTGTAQSLPDSPRHLTDRDQVRSKTEQLLSRLMSKSPVHKKRSESRPITVPRESEKLIAKLGMQLERLKKKHIGTIDDGGIDMLDSARDAKPIRVEAAKKESVPVLSESRSSSVALDHAPVVSQQEMKPARDEPVVQTKEKQAIEGGLGMSLPPTSPEIIDMGTEIAGPSDVSSIEDELFFANSKDTAKKSRRTPWKLPQKRHGDLGGNVTEKDVADVTEADHVDGATKAPATMPDMSPSRSRALSPKHYCVTCSRLLSYSPTRIRNRSLDRLLREEVNRWKRCQGCIERMFPSLFDPLLKRIVDKEGLISFEDGELLYELSGITEIPIRWEHKGQKKEFVSVLHLVLFELAINKDDVRKVASSADLNSLVEKERIQFVNDTDARIGGVLKSVCQLQVDQHPMLAHLLSKYHNVKLHVPETLESELECRWLAPHLGDVWCEIVGNVADYQSDTSKD